jgi:thioester reductase-like protein
VLLTGATGFVGSFLLAELQRSWPETTVVCLVRAAGPDEARARLKAGAHTLRTGADLDRPTVVALPGDLEQPRLGLTPGAFAQLAAQVDLVLHNGARVNLAEPYARVRAANIGGTQEVIRLAAARALPVHFVSTVGVLAGADLMTPLTEDMLAGATSIAANGYVRSKWVAELLLRQAHQRGLPTAVYRLARVSGHTVSGACRRDDAFWTVVKACLELGMAPRTAQWDAVQADLVPVDYAARAITQIMRHEEPDGRAYTLANPVRTPINAVLDRARLLGFEVENVPGTEWACRLGASAEGAYAGSAMPAAAVLSQLSRTEHLPPVQRYDRGNTLRALAGSGIECPVVGPDLLDRYLRYFVTSGHWPGPVPRTLGDARPVAGPGTDTISRHDPRAR